MGFRFSVDGAEMGRWPEWEGNNAGMTVPEGSGGYERREVAGSDGDAFLEAFLSQEVRGSDAPEPCAYA